MDYQDCTKCGTKVLLNKFPLDRKTSNGHKKTCFICTRKIQAAYRKLKKEQVDTVTTNVLSIKWV